MEHKGGEGRDGREEGEIKREKGKEREGAGELAPPNTKT
jgi:hypothetical protein